MSDWFYYVEEWFPVFNNRFTYFRDKEKSKALKRAGMFMRIKMGNLGTRAIMGTITSETYNYWYFLGYSESTDSKTDSLTLLDKVSSASFSGN